MLTKNVASRSLTGRILNSTIDNDASPTFTYTYDTVGRLVRAQTVGAAGVHDHVYCFDQTISGLCTSSDVSTTTGGYNPGRNSNRATWKDGATVQARYSYDAADRLTAITNAPTGSVSAPYQGQPISYDAHSNTTALAGETVGYDQSDRHLTTVKGATQVAYSRDATDRIIVRTGPDGTQRHTYSGTGDSGDGILNTSNQTLEALIVLPGGVLFTDRPSVTNDRWSYPNIHGDVQAVANRSGVKQGSIAVYDPYGTTATIPDNTTGNLDNAWLGQHQRPTEHTTNLQTSLDMGARRYNPAIGRFVEVDPAEGGSANDFDYCYGDPINCSDLDGAAPWDIVVNAAKAVGNAVKTVVRKTYQAARFVRNLPMTASGYAAARHAGARCRMDWGEVMVACTGARRTSFVRGGGTTYGSLFVTPLRRVSRRLMRHEARHADQWALFGPAFAGAYGAAYRVQGRCNIFERWAGLRDGGYRRC